MVQRACKPIEWLKDMSRAPTSFSGLAFIIAWCAMAIEPIELTTILRLPAKGDYALTSGDFVPDSSRLVLCFEMGGGLWNEIWSVDVETGCQERLFAPERSTANPLPLPGAPCVSPDGRQIAFSMNMESEKPFQRDVFVLQLKSLEYRNLTNSPCTSEVCLGWMSDGKRVAIGMRVIFEGNFSTLVFPVNLDGSNDTGNVIMVPGDPARSVKDNKVLFVERKRRAGDQRSFVPHVLDLSTWQVQKFPPRKLKHALGPPRYFYLAQENCFITNSGDGKVLLVGVSDDREVPLADGTALAVSCDGTKVLCRKTRETEFRYYLLTRPETAQQK